MFSHILGNDTLKRFFEKAIGENHLAQTLLFVGPDGIGKNLFARAIAKSLLQGEHSPDLHVYSPEGKSGLYAIDTLREMIEVEHAAPFQSPAKVFVLHDVDRMQPAAANALLKTLEEPTSDTTFILLTSHISQILPTILSRCSIFHFQSLTIQEIESVLLARGHPLYFAKLSHGSLGRAMELIEHPEFENERKILFSILDQRPSYPELMRQLNQLEASIDQSKEEDPLRSHRRVEHLFSSILMWHRDQLARSLGSSDLFFPEMEKREPYPLAQVEEVIDQARIAYSRNMKLSHVLSAAFLTNQV